MMTTVVVIRIGRRTGEPLRNLRHRLAHLVQTVAVVVVLLLTELIHQTAVVEERRNQRQIEVTGSLAQLVQVADRVGLVGRAVFAFRGTVVVLRSNERL